MKGKRVELIKSKKKGKVVRDSNNEIVVDTEDGNRVWTTKNRVRVL